MVPLLSFRGDELTDTIHEFRHIARICFHVSAFTFLFTHLEIDTCLPYLDLQQMDGMEGLHMEGESIGARAFG